MYFYRVKVWYDEEFCWGDCGDFETKREAEDYAETLRTEGGFMDNDVVVHQYAF